MPDLVDDDNDNDEGDVDMNSPNDPPSPNLDGDVPRMRQRSVEVRRSKCKSYVVLRGAILEQ